MLALSSSASASTTAPYLPLSELVRWLRDDLDIAVERVCTGIARGIEHGLVRIAHDHDGRPNIVAPAEDQA